MIHSLQFRLAVGAVLAVGLTLAMVWVALSRLFTDYVVKQYLTEMTVLSDSLAASAVIQDGKVLVMAAPPDPRFNLPAGGRYWALEQDGTVLERSRSFWDKAVSARGMKRSVYGPFLEGMGLDGQAILVLGQDSSLGDGRDTKRFRIYTAFPKAELRAALSSFNAELMRMLLVTAALLVLAAVVQPIVGLSPLNRLRRKVTEIRRGSV